MKLPCSVEVTALKLDGCVKSSRELGELVQHVLSQARKKHVISTVATFRFDPELALRVEVQDRGVRMRVPGRGVYAFSVDGVLRALADVIREEHGSDPALLDLYQALIEG